jgi:hypothetical protein
MPVPNPRSGQSPGEKRGKEGGRPPVGKDGHQPTSMPMRTAAWPALPGKTQPRPRGSEKKAKHYVKSEGL